MCVDLQIYYGEELFYVHSQWHSATNLLAFRSLSMLSYRIEERCVSLYGILSVFPQRLTLPQVCLLPEILSFLLSTHHIYICEMCKFFHWGVFIIQNWYHTCRYNSFSGKTMGYCRSNLSRGSENLIRHNKWTELRRIYSLKACIFFLSELDFYAFIKGRIKYETKYWGQR